VATTSGSIDIDDHGGEGDAEMFVPAVGAATAPVELAVASRSSATATCTERDNIQVSDGEGGEDDDNHNQNGRRSGNDDTVAAGGGNDEDDSAAENDDESEYEYDDDDGHYGGFIVEHDSSMFHSSTSASSGGHGHGQVGSAAVVPRDDEDMNDNNDADVDTDAEVSGSASAAVLGSASSSASASSRTISRETSVYDDGNTIQFASLDQSAALLPSSSASTSKAKSTSNSETESTSTSTSTKSTKSTWREPSQQAVSMSLRAEREKTGGRRRLAADLYKIMTVDTAEAGFSVESASENSMDKWTIRLFAFDKDSNLHEDMLVLGLDHIELEMSFPDQYPFEPPFVRVVRPRFKKNTGFVMSGALCMELLTSDGWNPVNDIESVIVSIRSLLVVGDGRLEAAADMSEEKRQKLLAIANSNVADGSDSADGHASGTRKKKGKGDYEDNGDDDEGEGGPPHKRKRSNAKSNKGEIDQAITGYSTAEAEAAYSHLSSYHKKKGWSGWWAQRG